jgi:hypothetical protein
MCHAAGEDKIAPGTGVISRPATANVTNVPMTSNAASSATADSSAGAAGQPEDHQSQGKEGVTVDAENGSNRVYFTASDYSRH